MSDLALSGFTEIPTVLALQLREFLAVLNAPDGELAKCYLEIATQIESNRGERERALAADIRAT